MPDAKIIDVPTDSGDAVPAIVLPDGSTRRLDRIAPERSNLLASPTVGETIGVLPRSEWPPTGTGAARVWSPIMNQASHGSCTGHGSVSHYMKLRALSGFAHVQLSATYIYAWVNGNRDAGASGSQACKVLVDHGTCTFEECGTETIYRSRIPKSADVTAARYRAFGLLACDSFDELATACIRLGGVAFAVQVGGSFNSLTPEGVAPAARGSGNHWIFADDVVRLKSGEWALEAQNSWGTSWGNGGRMRISETGYNNCGYSDATAFSGVLPDPQAPEEIPPVLVESESWPNAGGSEGENSGGGYPPDIA